MKKIFLYILLLCVCLIGNAQNSKLDSLFSIIKENKQDTNHVKTLIQIGITYSSARKFDTSIIYYKQALNLSEKINFKKGIANYYNNLGNDCYFQNNPNEAISNYLKSLKIRQEIDDKIGQANIYKNIANCNVMLANYNEALKNYLSAFKIYKSLNDNIGLSNALLGIGNVYQYQSNFSEAIKFYKESQKLKIVIGDKQGEISVILNIAGVYSLKGDLPEALKLYFICLPKMEEVGDTRGIANTYFGIGAVYYFQGNFTKSIDNYYLALKKYEQIGDNSNIAGLYLNIGSVLKDQNSTEDALKNYLLAVKKYSEIGNKSGLAYCHGNIGLIHYILGHFQEALNSQFTSLKIWEEIGGKQGIAKAYANIGSVYCSMAKIQTTNKKRNYYLTEALKMQNEALKINQEIENKHGISSTSTNIGNIYLELNKLSDAKNWIQKGLSLAKEIGSKEFVRANYLGLAMVDSAGGNYQSAYNNYKLFVAYRDSLNNEENTKKVTQAQMQFEFDKKQSADSLSIANERAVNELKFEEEKKQRYFLIGGLILLGLFAIFIFNRFKVTQKQKHIIEVKEKETHEQKLIIEEKHKEITDSINYAERIQRSFLATQDHLNNNLQEYFILFKPKDVVSGDFYWSANLNNGNFALVTADSTGHGVPGAIMSLLNITSLEKAIETCISPDDILNATRKIIIDRLKKDGSADGGKDGMDCSLCVYDFKSSKLYIAAAHNPVWIVRTSEAEANVIEIKPDKMPVGKHDKQDLSFNQTVFDLQKGDVVYTLTDGFPDQFGGEKGKKFMSKNLRELLSKNAHLPMNEQKIILENALINWVGNLEQVDDITVIGVRV